MGRHSQSSTKLGNHLTSKLSQNTEAFGFGTCTTGMKRASCSDQLETRAIHFVRPDICFSETFARCRGGSFGSGRERKHCFQLVSQRRRSAKQLASQSFRRYVGKPLCADAHHIVLLCFNAIKCHQM